jgi:predicted nucleic acid-binding protein
MRVRAARQVRLHWMGKRIGLGEIRAFKERHSFVAERKRRITPIQSEAFIADLGKLDIERDEAPDRAFTHLLALCRTHRLTSYAAIYLDRAVRRNLPLGTLDEDLRNTAKKLGARLLA